LGHSVPLIAYLQPQNYLLGSAYKFFTTLQMMYGGVMVRVEKRDLRQELERIKPDLVVCRGDWYPHYKVAKALGIPYLLIEHDCYSLRKHATTGEIENERQMVEGAAGIIYTNVNHQKHIEERYNVTPGHVVWLRPLAKDVMFEPLPKLPGKTIVYAGGLQPYKAADNLYGYRCYHDAFIALMKAGWDLHVYCAAPNNHTWNVDEYAALGCKMHEPIEEKDLPREMSQYTAGFLCYAPHAAPRAYAYAHLCLPNKAFQWLGAGIPTLALDAGYAGTVVEEGGWGVQATWKNLGRVKLPKITEAMRRANVFEHQAPILRRAVSRAMMYGGVQSRTIEVLPPRTKEAVPKVSHITMRGTNEVYTAQMRIVVNGYVRYKRGAVIPMDEALELAREGCIVDPALNDRLKAAAERAAARAESARIQRELEEQREQAERAQPYDPRTDTKPDGPKEYKGRCTAMTARGQRCKRNALPGSDKCRVHSKE